MSRQNLVDSLEQLSKKQFSANARNDKIQTVHEGEKDLAQKRIGKIKWKAILYKQYTHVCICTTNKNGVQY